MKKLFLSIVFLASLFIGAKAYLSSDSNVYAFGGCESDCQKCHTLDTKEVQQILTKIKTPDVKVLDIKISAVKGLWEVTVEDKGTKGIMYVGFSKKYIMSGPIFEVETALNKTQETMNDINQKSERYVDFSKISLDKALVMGSKDAEHKVVVFTDPDCPFCGKLHDELKKIISEKKDIAFYIKLMPLSFHPDAHWKSQSIICSNSLKMLEDNFENKPVPKPECKTDEVDANIKLGEELGITGTPTLIMPDGFVILGARDAKIIIETVLIHKKKENQK